MNKSVRQIPLDKNYHNGITVGGRSFKLKQVSVMNMKVAQPSSIILADETKKSQFYYVKEQQKYTKTDQLTKSTAESMFGSQKRIKSELLKQNEELTISQKPIPSLLFIKPSEMKYMVSISSKSLKRQIQTTSSSGNFKQYTIGIGSTTEMISKKSGDYCNEKAICQTRMRKPQFFKSMMNNFVEMCQPISKDQQSLRQICKNQKFIDHASEKYFPKNNSVRLMGDALRKGDFNVAEIIERSVKETMKVGQNILVNRKIKRDVQQLVSDHDKALNYRKIREEFAQDSMFKIDSKDFKKYSEQYMLENKFTGERKNYHKYYDNYTHVKDHIFYHTQADVDKYKINDSASSRSSDDTVALNEFYENNNQADIQFHNYGNNIRNPFLMDDKLIKIMKLSGILKKQLKINPLDDE